MNPTAQQSRTGTPTSDDYAAADAVEHDVFAETMRGHGGAWSDHRRSFNNGYAQACADLRAQLQAKELELAEDRAIRQSVIDDLRQRLTARDATIAGLIKTIAFSLCCMRSGENGADEAARMRDAALAQVPPLPSAVPVHPDTARLDWLDGQGQAVTYEDAPHAMAWVVQNEPGQDTDIRKAIDAARQSTGGQKT